MTRGLILLSLFLAPAGLPASAADGTISTMAGAKAAAAVPAVNSVLGLPRGMAVDAIGNIYVADTANNRIRRIDVSSGVISNFAGMGVAGSGGDLGPAVLAQLNAPRGIFLASEVSPIGLGMVFFLYIADTGNHRVRRVNLSTGIIEPVAGNGSPNYGGDNGPAVLASLNAPAAVAVGTDASLGGTAVYIADAGNFRIRRVNPATGVITSYAGTGANSFSGDAGAAASAAISGVQALFFAGYNSSLYLADTGNHRVRRINTATQSITTVAGTGTPGYLGGGVAMDAQLQGPNGVFVDSGGNLLISDSGNHVLRMVSVTTQAISVVAGTPQTAGYSGDGAAATSASLSQPLAGAQDAVGNIYFIDRGNNCLRQVAAGTQVISTRAGNGVQEDVDPTLVQLSNPMALAVSPSRHLIYVAEGSGNRVRRVSASTGRISTLAGTGAAPVATLAPTPVAASGFALNPTGMAVGPDGTVYVSDGETYIQAIDGAGQVRRFAGYGSSPGGYSGDGGPALSADMAPGALCVSGSNLYFMDVGSFVLRRISLGDGLVHYVAGGGAGTADGLSVTAGFLNPKSIAAGPGGEVYVADTANHKIRKVQVGASSMVSTICGLGQFQGGYSGDGGLAVNAAINTPEGIVVDAQGNVYFGDSSSNRVRRIDAVTGKIETVVGVGLAGFSGDGGPARSASIYFPSALLFDGPGAFYVADRGNNNVRKVDYSLPTPVAGSANKPVAYPSPTKGPICFSYYTQSAGKVTVEAYNSSLRLVARFEDNATAAGAQLSCTDLKGLANGAYIFRITPNGSPAVTGKFKVIQ